jgi:hypothetical protein
VGPGGLEDRTRASGAHCWFERRMFEILGSWVPTTHEPEAKLMLDRHSLHHSWRATQWGDRLPVVSGVDREALVAAPGAGTEKALDALSGMRGTVDRLAGAYRVAIPRLAGVYAADLAAASGVCDGSVIRTLGIVSADLEADWREGEFFLQRLLTDRAEVQSASRAVAELEMMLT